MIALGGVGGGQGDAFSDFGHAGDCYRQAPEDRRLTEQGLHGFGSDPAVREALWGLVPNFPQSSFF